MAIKNLSAKVNAIEQSISSFQKLRVLSNDVSPLRSFAVALETYIAGLTSRLGDPESRSRHNNLIFYGVADGLSPGPFPRKTPRHIHRAPSHHCSFVGIPGTIFDSKTAADHC